MLPRHPRCIIFILYTQFAREMYTCQGQRSLEAIPGNDCASTRSRTCVLTYTIGSQPDDVRLILPRLTCMVAYCGEKLSIALICSLPIMLPAFGGARLYWPTEILRNQHQSIQLPTKSARAGVLVTLREFMQSGGGHVLRQSSTCPGACRSPASMATA